MALVALEDTARVSSLVLRLLGLNPGLYTLQGTNTYIVGAGRERILIDTGDGVPGWATLLESAAQDQGFVITKVILTHWHHDHVSGLADVRRIAAASWAVQSLEVYKCPDPEHDGQVGDTFLPLVDGGTVAVEGATLRAVATPGHTDDHLCLFLEEEGALFSGDMVLGQGTAVFASLRQYMASLAKARTLAPTVLYPGHGPVVPDGTGKLTEYLNHRNAREQQVLAQLRQAGTPQTIPEIVSVIYAAYPVELHVPAQGSVLQHLVKLLEEGRVRRLEPTVEDGLELWALTGAAADVVTPASL